MRDEHERSQELKELFKRFDALNGDEEELKAKKAKWAGSRVAWLRLIDQNGVTFIIVLLYIDLDYNDSL